MKELYLDSKLAPDGKPIIVLPFGYCPVRVKEAERLYLILSTRRSVILKRYSTECNDEDTTRVQGQ
ncbi:Uncharacterised protein [uncultured archaeon]|nr:Uncharacterised protein [uncultured archaeon]